MSSPGQMGFGDYTLPAVLHELRPARLRGTGYDLLCGDSLELLARLPGESVDLVFADPPYNLSNGGTTVRSGERASVDKGEWDRSAGVAEDHAFHRAWLAECRRLLKPTGSLWVSGTHHVAFSVGYALQELGFHVLNAVTWFKPNPPPNYGCRQLTHSTELLLWAAPAAYEPLQHTFHYEALKAANGGRQMRDLWTFAAPARRERQHGLGPGETPHPTQKPAALLARIIAASCNRGDLVLDPFNGSGTTGVIAVAAGCRYIGIDLDERWLELTARRIALGPPPARAARGGPEDEEEASLLHRAAELLRGVPLDHWKATPRREWLADFDALEGAGGSDA